MKPQLIGTCVVVLDKEKRKVLLGKRLNGYKSGFYGLPGGRLELIEKLEDGGKRELLEETGLIAVNLDYLGAIRDLQVGYNFIHFAYSCNNYKGEPKAIESDKCEGWEWFDFDQIPENILPGHKAAIDLYINSHLPPVRDISSI